MKYIDKLTDGEFDYILEPAGLKLDKHNTSGSELPYVDKGIDENGLESDTYILHVIDTDENKISAISRLMMVSSMMGMFTDAKNYYGNCCDVVLMNDYNIALLSDNPFSEEDKNKILLDSMTSYLANKFPTYVKDYNDYVIKYNEKLKEDSENEM